MLLKRRLHKIELLDSYSQSFNRRYEDMNLDNLFCGQSRSVINNNILKDIIEAFVFISLPYCTQY